MARNEVSSPWYTLRGVPNSTGIKTRDKCIRSLCVTRVVTSVVKCFHTRNVYTVGWRFNYLSRFARSGQTNTSNGRALLKTDVYHFPGTPATPQAYSTEVLSRGPPQAYSTEVPRSVRTPCVTVYRDSRFKGSSDK